MCITLANKHSVAGASPALLVIIMENENYIKIDKDWWWFFNDFNEDDILRYVEESLNSRDIIANKLVEEC